MPDDAPLAVSVVILTFNSARYLPVCLDELARSRDVELEVIVVDNDSGDGSADIAEAHPSVTKTIRTGANLGCAGGNNVGWRAATHPIIVMLNADCAVEPDTVRRMAEPLASDPTIGLTGAKLLYPNTRTIQHAGGILHPNFMAEHYGMGELDEGQWDEDRDVDFVTGALIAFRRADIAALGGLDEEFFPAYFEETDLCFRFRASGRRVRYIAGAVGYHWESVGVGLLSPRFLKLLFRGRMIFAVKNLTFATFWTRFCPFELKWLMRPGEKKYRRAIIQSYGFGVIFALRCLLRLNRRPRGVFPRLAPLSGEEVSKT